MQITDEIVAAGAKAYDELRRARYSLGYYQWHEPAMRAALEAAVEMILEDQKILHELREQGRANYYGTHMVRSEF